MKMPTLRSTLLIIWAFLGLIVPISNLYAPPAMPVGGQPQISEEDLKFLEDLGKQIQDEVAKLPTREQLKAQGLSDIEIERGEKQGKIQTKDKFDEDVAKYSAMSEEELYAEMEKALAEVEKASTPEAQPEYPSAGIYQGEAEAPTPAPTPVPTKPAVSSNKQQAAIQLIDSLLAHISKFLSKAQAMVELPLKITSWIKEGKLKNWPATLNWNSFRGQVEELQAKLNKIKDKDTKTGSYKYLDDLIKDEATYNILVKIKDALARSEPKIALSSGIDKMTTASRQAVRDTLLSLYEAVSTLGIAASLDKIIEKYEPTAKKIKESEEAAQRKALEESRRGRTPGYTTVGGYPKYEGDYRGRYDFGDGGHGFTPGKFEAPEREKAREESSKKDKAAAGAGGAAKPEVKKPEDKKAGAAEKPKREEDKRADELAKDFNNSIYEILDALDANPLLAKIESHMNDDKFVDEEVYKEGIPQLVDGVSKAVKSAKLLKRQLGKKTLTDEQKKEFKKEVRDGYNKDLKGDLEKLSKQLENVSKAGASSLVSGITSKNDLFTQAKTYAYFGKKNEDAFKKKIDEDKKTIADATAKATAAGTALDPRYVKMDADVKRAEGFLAKKEGADLSMLNDKIKALQKAVAEL